MTITLNAKSQSYQNKPGNKRLFFMFTINLDFDGEFFIMKKLFILFPAFFIIISLYSCGVNRPEKEPTNNNENSDPTPSTENVLGKTNEYKEDETMQDNLLYITANGVTFTAKFENSPAAEEFKKKLVKNDLTITMHDYGNFEKVGELGFALQRNDSKITTVPGDVILYNGNYITIYYDTNSWTFTKLGKIENVTKIKAPIRILSKVTD